MGDGDGRGHGITSIDVTLEKHWSSLSFLGRAAILHDIGILEYNEFHMGGKTIVDVLKMNQEDLPSEVRGRLMMSLTAEGFSKKEYEKVKETLFKSKKGPERG